MPLDLLEAIGSTPLAVLSSVGGSSGTNVTVLPDAWDRYRAKPWMQGWGA
jgi:hypothetical protein